jgi:phosphoglycerate dehydrogenase-like enzyme
MSNTKFRLGLTRDLLTPSGTPSFGMGALEVLNSQPNIEWEYLPESLTEITPDVAARYDGLYVNSPQVTAASVARADRRVRIVARHGVGYDSVDVAALAAQGVTVTNTPVAVRRPVAVASLTLIFALAGRLFAKDRLIRAGRWHERTGHMGLGLTTRTLGVIGAGGIGRELLALAKPFGWRMLAAESSRSKQLLEAQRDDAMHRCARAEQSLALAMQEKAVLAEQLSHTANRASEERFVLEHQRGEAEKRAAEAIRRAEDVRRSEEIRRAEEVTRAR